MCLYISKASLYQQSCAFGYITFPSLAKIYYASESNFRYVFAGIWGFASAKYIYQRMLFIIFIISIITSAEVSAEV